MPTAARPSGARHAVLALLVLHYVNTYMDRICIAAAAPLIQREFGIDPLGLGIVFGAFTLAYGLFQIPGGWLADRFGPRRVLTAIVCYWSVFTMATAAAWSMASLVVIRFLFGSGEAGAFPAATRALSRWLPPTERGFAQGITHTGSRLGGAVTPPIVVAVAHFWGWRWAFLGFGVLGFVWAALWYAFYRDDPEKHRGVNAAELALIRGAAPPQPPSPGRLAWRALLASRQLRALCWMYAGYGYTVWIYFTWFPSYLVGRGFGILASGFLASVPLLAGAATNALGGWLSDRLVVRRGLTFGRRAVAQAGFVTAVAAIGAGVMVEDPYAALVLFTFAAAGLELTTGVSWAAAIDLGRDQAGTVSAAMNMCGNLGGALSAVSFGALVQATGSWELPFAIGGGLCLLSALCWLRIDPAAPLLPAVPERRT